MIGLLYLWIGSANYVEFPSLGFLHVIATILLRKHMQWAPFFTVLILLIFYIKLQIAILFFKIYCIRKIKRAHSASWFN